MSYSEHEIYHPDQSLYHPRGPATYVNTEALAMSIADPLTQIADAIRRLTYGEMVRLAAEISGSGELSPQSLPDTLHKWSTANAEKPSV
jgi:hypothetical protein